LDGAVKGIITDRDLLACLAEAHDPYRCKISAHMKRPVIVLRPEEDDATAAAVMRERRIKRIPIAKNGKLLGMVSLSDLAALASDEAGRLRPSLRFFTDVVRTQSSQHRLPSGSSPYTPLVRAVEESTENSNRTDLLEAGGPG
jgi:predicted transcriptional regulator